MAQAHICQAVVQAMGGKGVKLEKFLLIDRKTKQSRNKEGKSFFTDAD